MTEIQLKCACALVYTKLLPLSPHVEFVVKTPTNFSLPRSIKPPPITAKQSSSSWLLAHTVTLLQIHLSFVTCLTNLKPPLLSKLHPTANTLSKTKTFPIVTALTKCDHSNDLCTLTNPISNSGKSGYGTKVSTSRGVLSQSSTNISSGCLQRSSYLLEEII